MPSTETPGDDPLSTFSDGQNTQHVAQERSAAQLTDVMLEPTRGQQPPGQHAPTQTPQSGQKQPSNSLPHAMQGQPPQHHQQQPGLLQMPVPYQYPGLIQQPIHYQQFGQYQPPMQYQPMTMQYQQPGHYQPTGHYQQVGQYQQPGQYMPPMQYQASGQYQQMPGQQNSRSHAGLAAVPVAIAGGGAAYMMLEGPPPLPDQPGMFANVKRGFTGAARSFGGEVSDQAAQYVVQHGAQMVSNQASCCCQNFCSGDCDGSGGDD
jgi:hypothetical protein